MIACWLLKWYIPIHHCSSPSDQSLSCKHYHSTTTSRFVYYCHRYLRYFIINTRVILVYFEHQWQCHEHVRVAPRPRYPYPDPVAHENSAFWISLWLMKCDFWAPLRSISVHCQFRRNNSCAVDNHHLAPHCQVYTLSTSQLLFNHKLESPFPSTIIRHLSVSLWYCHCTINVSLVTNNHLRTRPYSLTLSLNPVDKTISRSIHYSRFFTLGHCFCCIHKALPNITLIDPLKSVIRRRQ